jgi:hypothetical protein
VLLVAASLLLGTLPILPASAEQKENMNRVGGVPGSTGGHIVFEGNRLYMGTYGVGMRLFDITDPKAPKHLGSYEPGTALQPRADAVPDAAVFNGRHIAVLNGTGRTGNVPPNTPLAGLNTKRTEFVDWTNPASPQLLHTFGPGPEGEAHNGDIFDAKKLWLPSGGGSGTVKNYGLRIYDMQPLLDNPPDPMNLTPANDPKRIFPPDSCWTGPDLVCDPVSLWRNSPFRGNQPVGEPFVHTHDITIYPNHPVALADGAISNRDIILLAEGGDYARDNANNGSVFVIDITDPANPVVLYRWLHQTGPGHHPIRYHHEAMFIEGKPNLMVVSDEDLHHGCQTAGGVVAVQLSPDLKSGTEMSEWFIPNQGAAVCSAHVFSTRGNLMFMGSYNAGTQVVDYSDPAKPKRVGYFIGDGSTAWGSYYNPANGFVYVGDADRGLDVLEFLGPIPGIPSVGTGPGGTTPPPRVCPGRASSPLPQLVGSEQKDELRGGSAKEIICGLGNNDVIRGGGGDDLIIAGSGRDSVNGGAGNDKLLGKSGNDKLRGGPGRRDKCVGGKGKDRAARCERGKV